MTSDDFSQVSNDFSHLWPVQGFLFPEAHEKLPHQRCTGHLSCQLNRVGGLRTSCVVTNIYKHLTYPTSTTSHFGKLHIFDYLSFTTAQTMTGRYLAAKSWQIAKFDANFPFLLLPPAQFNPTKDRPPPRRATSTARRKTRNSSLEPMKWSSRTAASRASQSGHTASCDDWSQHGVWKVQGLQPTKDQNTHAYDIPVYACIHTFLGVLKPRYNQVIYIYSYACLLIYIYTLYVYIYIII